MATTTHTQSSPLRTLRVGVALALLATAIDVIGMIAIGLPNAPIAVNIITSVLAVATVIGGIFAWNGAVWGTWTVIASRALSALSIVPIFLVPEVPNDVIPMSVVVVALAIVAVVLLIVGLARRNRSS